LNLLRRCKFGEKRRVSSLTFSVLGNDTPHSSFSSCRCLNQGDPLSLLLFVIIMGALNIMLYATVNMGFLSGFSVGSRNIGVHNISHLLFVGNTLIFCEENPYHVLYLCGMFFCFEVVSKLKINLV
jgi:hypothetical protein